MTYGMTVLVVVGEYYLQTLCDFDCLSSLGGFMNTKEENKKKKKNNEEIRFGPIVRMDGGLHH